MNEENKLVGKIILFLYLIVGFVPSFNTLDSVSTQWLYISILNVFVLAFFYLKRKQFDFSIKGKITFLFFGTYVAFFLASCLSMVNAVIISESIVSLSRLSTIIISFGIVYFLLKENPKESFNFFVLITSVLLLIESFYVLNYFFENIDKPRFGDLLKGLKTSHGNRNVLAASIVLKMPFLLYVINKSKGLLKLIPLLIFVLSSLSVFLIGARTAILSLTLGVLFFIVISLIDSNKKNRKFSYYLNNLISVLLGFFLSLFIATQVNLIDKSKSNSFDDLINTKSKTVLNKDYKIPLELKVDKDATGRMLYWKLAIENFKEHPVLGVGTGNWKMYSKEKILRAFTQNKYTYPKRVHNDFLQVLAETGLFGFLIFLSIVIILVYILLKNVIFKINNENLYIFLVLSLSFMIYIFDALLNFPHERTPIQVLAIFLFAFILIFNNFQPLNKKDFHVSKWVFPLFLMLSVVSLNYNFLVYKSSKVQRIMFDNYVGKNLLEAKYNISYNEIIKKLPDFPIINEIGRPIEHSKAMFAYSEGKFDLAMQHLNKSIKIAPNQIEHMGLKAILFYKEDKVKNLDSAFFYAKKVFDIFPPIKSNLTILKKHYVDKKDTANVFKTINTFLKRVPSDVDEWINKAKYIKFYYNDSKRALEVIDSAILLNPNNKTITSYKKDSFKINLKTATQKDTIKNTDAEIKFIKEHYGLGMKHFNDKQYAKAKKEFDKVRHVRPNNNPNLINLALIEIKLKNYTIAIAYLDKVIATNFMNNGQPEYNRGLCYLRLGNKKKAAVDFRLSKNKGYQKALKLAPSLLKD